MFDRSDLKAAVAASIISAEQAARLESFALSRRRPDAAGSGGQEDLRFLSNFNDIFITLGLLILFGGVSAFLGVSGMSTLFSGKPTGFLILFLPIAGLAWLMLEYFCARRRMLLPSMALSIIFVFNIAAAATAVATSFADIDFNADAWGLFETTGNIGLTGFAAGTAAAIAIYFRFRLPFALALAALSAAAFFYTMFGFGGRIGYVVGGSLSVILGLATMAAAVWFDMKDPERVTKASDNAFWLHLAAAPQIITGITTMVTGSNIFAGSTSGTDNAGQMLSLLVVLIVLGIASLALNRRALIAASILTFMFALSFILGEAGFDVSTIVIMVAIMIGGGVVLLGAGWSTARKLALKLFPTGGIWDRLFPPEPA